MLRGAGIGIALPTLDAMIDGRGRWYGLANAACAPPARVMAFQLPPLDRSGHARAIGARSPELLYDPVLGDPERRPSFTGGDGGGRSKEERARSCPGRTRPLADPRRFRGQGAAGSAHRQYS